jgi:hypothetical protein
MIFPETTVLEDKTSRSGRRVSIPPGVVRRRSGTRSTTRVVVQRSGSENQYKEMTMRFRMLYKPGTESDAPPSSEIRLMHDAPAFPPDFGAEPGEWRAAGARGLPAGINSSSALCRQHRMRRRIDLASAAS